MEKNKPEKITAKAKSLFFEKTQVDRLITKKREDTDIRTEKWDCTQSQRY